MRLVYMDNNATTELHPEVIEKMNESFRYYGNASSMHSVGRESKEQIEEARNKVADLIGASPEEIIFTSGGSESNNTIINGIACGLNKCVMGKGKNHIITSKIEHPSVMNTLQCREKQGIKVSYISNDRMGYVNIDELEAAITPETTLITIIYANNEIGTIQDIKRINEIAVKHNILMHTDSVQAVGKILLNVKDLGVDFLSISGHKLHGPKGTGVLYVKKGR
ncbi:MAG: aminotransferase class V-fold PLP-dependent enzyme, partial [Actinomycetia bacterium]|nr:aminotransferase class V-fold PLP-dependent enzyme [Actinomycetes bacterium]